MKILVLAAHMDDEVLGVGGTLAKHVAAGDDVTVCIACKRAYNHEFKREWDEAEKASTLRAAKILGCREVRFLGLRDELLDERLLDVIVPLERVVEAIKPQVVYTHHRGDANQDHRAVFQATLVACRPISKHRVPRLLSFEVPSSTDMSAPFVEYVFQPNYYVDIHRFLAAKIRALESYRREIRRFPHPRSREGIRIFAQKRGMEAGFLAAEAFMFIRDQWA